MMNLKISAIEFVEEVKTGNISVEEFIGKTLERIMTLMINFMHFYL